MQNMRFEGKVVIVTGASSGIGRSTARLFAMEGAKVVAAATSLRGLKRNISASFFERGIRCNCIEPANILTEINKVPREKGIGILEWQMRAGKAAPLHTITKPGEKKPMLGKLKDCANAIAYLADDVAARYISGAELKVDAGWLNM